MSTGNFLALVQFRTGPMTDGIKRCWCMHSTMVCATVCFIPSGFGPVRNCTNANFFYCTQDTHGTIGVIPD